MAPITEEFYNSPSYRLFSVSMTGDAFTYYGEQYEQVRVYDDGYLCFGRIVTPVTFKNTEPSSCQADNLALESHFSGGMPCFSYLLAGLAGTVTTPTTTAGKGGYSFRRCYQNKAAQNNAAAEAHKTIFSFEEVRLEGIWAIGETLPRVTVQVTLEFPDKITVSYKDIHESAYGVIGPSQGMGTPANFAATPIPQVY